MNFKALACKTIIILILLIPPSSIQAFGLVWVIADPARDMNWDLKTIKKYLILAEKKLAKADEMLGKQILTQMEQLKKEADKSSSIRAITSALSITQNISSENRYAPTTATGLVCSMIATESGTDTCGMVISGNVRNMKNLELRFLDSQKADATYYRNVMQVNNLNHNSAEKDAIKKIVLNINNYSSALNQYRLIDQKEYDTFEPITDLIFDWEVTLPKPDEIISHPSSVRPEMFKQAFDAATAKGFVTRSLKDRTQGARQYARDAATIQAGSNEVLDKLMKELADSEMSEDALRLIALTKAKRLTQRFKQLEVNLRNNSTAALKLKQLSELKARGRL